MHSRSDFCFIHSFIRSFVRLFILLFIYPLNASLIHSVFHSMLIHFSHSFLHTLKHVCLHALYLSSQLPFPYMVISLTSINPITIPPSTVEVFSINPAPLSASSSTGAKSIESSNVPSPVVVSSACATR